MKLLHNNAYNNEFAQIKNITYYPYVGEDFGKGKNRILVFAHNIPVKPELYESEVIRTKSKTHFADALEEYSYEKGKNYTAFRNFIKGSIGLDKEYINSDPKIIEKVDKFVSEIAYTNFIDGLVKTDKKVNAIVSKEMKEASKYIAIKLLNILDISHCICWGRQVYNYVTKLESFHIVETKPIQQRGFSYALIKNIKSNKTIHLLRIHHPSMPGFKQYYKSTHDIFSWFYNL